MKTLRIVSLVVLFSVSIPFALQAGDFDGSKTLLCSVISVTEYTPEDGSQLVSAESIGLPRFLKVDFEKKKVIPAMDREVARYSDIKRVERLGGKVILQGADEGMQDVRNAVGWTATISEETGRFMLAASGEEVAFVVFGACMPY